MTKLCSTCKKRRDLSLFCFDKRRQKHHARCRFCHREYNNRRNRALRVTVLTHYGGDPPKCACCGEGILEFLALDHIHGGGRQHRRTIKVRWWEWLRDHGYPKGFRVLCHNCNQAWGVYGSCPHQTSISFLADAAASYDELAPSKSWKLTQAKAEEIRHLIAQGMPQCEIAKQYNVSRATICLINKQKHWRS